ncbi:hypothetical protein BURMUCF1_A2036 [Burkholderia multivorans ATCC BAA-247]|nr:hypothetical protein BURMUCF1_A2036 [Burkholderia multivorans ATCC BAA-247]
MSGPRATGLPIGCARNDDSSRTCRNPARSLARFVGTGRRRGERHAARNTHKQPFTSASFTPRIAEPWRAPRRRTNRPPAPSPSSSCIQIAQRLSMRVRFRLASTFAAAYRAAPPDIRSACAHTDR